MWIVETTTIINRMLQSKTQCIHNHHYYNNHYLQFFIFYVFFLLSKPAYCLLITGKHFSELNHHIERPSFLHPISTDVIENVAGSFIEKLKVDDIEGSPSLIDIPSFDINPDFGDSLLLNSDSFIEVSKKNPSSFSGALTVERGDEAAQEGFVEKEPDHEDANSFFEEETGAGEGFMQKEGDVVFGDRTNKELIEALKREEYEIKTGEKGEEKEIQGEMKERDKETVRIRDYYKTMRKGGLEGTVGAVTYNTPNKLQDKMLEMVKTIDTAISNFSPSEGLQSILERLPPRLPTRAHLSQWEEDVPYIQFIRQMIIQACPKQDIDNAGDPSIQDAFPRCMIDYVSALPEETKKDMGLRLRAAVQSTELINQILNLKDGLCVPVGTVLNIGNQFCSDVLEIFRSVPAFVKASTVIQEKEKEYYGTEAAMIERNTDYDKTVSFLKDESFFEYDSLETELMESLSNEQVSLVDETLKISKTEESINKLQGRLVFRRTWITLGMHTMKQEALHLQEVWYNDPIHKWRYTLGLFQWITVMGVWLTDETAKIVK